MRAPVDHIAAPPFPRGLAWANSPPQQLEAGRAMVVEFWDFCRPQSIRTLPYVKAWHERYPELKVIGVHAAGFPPSHDPDAVVAAVGRLEIPYPVAIDAQYEVWSCTATGGWPARYLFDQRNMLLHYHYGEGGYAETEQAIQELLGIERPLLSPLRPEEAPTRVSSPSRTTSRGPDRGRTRRRGVGGARGRRHAHRQRPHGRRRPSRLLRADRARAQHERRAGARGRRRRHLPRRLLHARPQSSRLTSSGGPESPTIAANPER